MDKNNESVTIDLKTARLIRAAFLPRNPNKMRNAHPDVVLAVRRFLEILEEKA